VREKTANRDQLKAAEVREMVGKLQKESIKLFEAAYTKRASQNQQGASAESGSTSTSSTQEAEEVKGSEEEGKKASN